MQSIVIFTLILLTKISFSSSQSISPKIIGGRDAEINEFPYMVSIRRTDQIDFHICGGAIISERTVLTAAHCMFDQFGNVLSKPISFTVFSNVTKISADFPYTIDSWHLATNITVHPDFNGETFQNDIAIIEVFPSFKFSESTQMIDIDFNQTYPADIKW